MVKGYFFNAVKENGQWDRTYDSEDICRWLEKIVGDGVFADPTSNFQVMADSGMTISVQPGQAWIRGHKCINTAAESLTLTAAPVGTSETQLVMLRLNYSSRVMDLVVDTVRQQGPNMYDIILAEIAVSDITTQITQDMITDTRFDGAKCGVVKGLIDQIDTTDLFAQYDETFNNALTANQAEFDQFIDDAQKTIQNFGWYQRYEWTESTLGQIPMDVIRVKDYIPQYSVGDDVTLYISGLLVPRDDYQTDGSGNITLFTPITHDAYITIVVRHFVPQSP